MTKRRSIEAMPWCWYCDREFEDDKVLIQHQKAKHFKCSICHKKMNSAPSMVIHVAQVHKQPIYQVPNTLEGRSDVNMQIFGMQGVPVADLVAHYQEVGANAEPMLKKLNLESHSYAHGPGSMSRTPGISSLMGAQLMIKKPEEALDVRSALQANAALPPPLLASAAGKKPSSTSSSATSLDSFSETDTSSKSDVPAVEGSSKVPGKITNYACQKAIGKNCILVYSSERSIEERRLQKFE